MFISEYDLTKAAPASYNPRVIDDEARDRLCSSIAELGVVKPIIVTDSGLILAGHQRTAAMRSMDMTVCPAFVLSGTNDTDEVRFNQLHNGADVELEETGLKIPGDLAPGWYDIPPEQILGRTVSPTGARRAEILNLLTRYGTWGAAVALTNGEIVVSGLYAAACRQLCMPCTVCVVHADNRAALTKYFGGTYGKFSYSHLPKTTWVQSLAQLQRLQKADSGSETAKSRTYENGVLPRLTNQMRALDFGAGRMQYVDRLQKVGFRITGVEFYYRTKGCMQIDVPSVHRHIDRLCADLRTHGLYDMVICDSVLNSVDSVQSESDVMTCLNSLCRLGGIMIFSGRSRTYVENIQNTMQRCADAKGRRYLVLLDQDGMTGMYRSGVWQYQKFHTIDQVRLLASQYTGTQWTISDSTGKANPKKINTSGWMVTATKSMTLDTATCEAALAREFDLPLPDGSRYGRSEDIISAWRAAVNL